MKTLVFCTAYADRRATWDSRQAWWLKALRNSELQFDQLLMVDDGSPELPTWQDVEIHHEDAISTPAALRSSAPVLIYTHRSRLGRRDVFDFPGWYRSFAFGAEYGRAHGFQKIIHLESDAFLVSHRLQSYFNTFREGWCALWSDRYTFPEIAVQVAGGREVDAMAAFSARPYGDLAGRLHETALPYTHVDTYFFGDRFGEDGVEVPRYADFAAQTPTGMPNAYYWWIPPRPVLTRGGGLDQIDGAPPRTQHFPPFLDLQFGGGWSHAEPGIRWMIGVDSRVFVPAMSDATDHEIELDVRPSRETIEGQKLYILVNDHLIASLMLLRSTTISCRVPASAIRAGGANCLRFVHPDASSPAELGLEDLRLLSIGVTRISIQGCSPSLSAPRRRRSLFGL
jgi:hypothetical protein